jgi:hypothetical protein
MNHSVCVKVGAGVRSYGGRKGGASSSHAETLQAQRVMSRRRDSDRPRWSVLGVLSVAVACVVEAFPHTRTLAFGGLYFITGILSIASSQSDHDPVECAESAEQLNPTSADGQAVRWSQRGQRQRGGGEGGAHLRAPGYQLRHRAPSEIVRCTQLLLGAELL